MDNQGIYIFGSLATAQDTPDGKIVPVEGMKLIAAIAHRYSIPVTWIVDSHSVESAGDVLNQWHKEFGDDLALHIDISRILTEDGVMPESEAERTVILRQKLPQFIGSEREKIKGVLPWADVKIAYADIKSKALLVILEDMEFEGLWGYSWSPAPIASTRRRSSADDQETDDHSLPLEGCTWGFFYASKEHHDAPAQSADGLVAVESTSVDLNSGFHTGNPGVFSANPNSLRKSGLCVDANVNYPEALLNEYLRNLPWNRFLSFVQQQPAREMEYASYDEYSEGTIRELADIMEDLFKAVSSNPAINAVSVVQAAELYRKEFEYTESCYMIFDGIVPAHLEINYYMPPEPRQKPPYPFTFLCYDRECQMIFKEGDMTPVEMRNYFRPPFESRHYLEREMPSISYFRPSRDRDKLILEFEIESVKRMPFGLAIWDDHTMFNLVSTNARLVKWVGDYLLFIRMDLEEGLNRVEVSLVI